MISERDIVNKKSLTLIRKPYHNESIATFTFHPRNLNVVCYLVLVAVFRVSLLSNKYNMVILRVSGQVNDTCSHMVE